tara:strand:+ start:173 stop:412 length:240 start_codon:yes stop_codon:yes gene_type:complete
MSTNNYITKPIPIPNSTKKESLVEYNLNENCINPTNKSPPNSWNTRLEIRVKHFSSKDFSHNNNNNYSNNTYSIKKFTI